MTDTDTTEGKGGEAVRGSNYENARTTIDGVMEMISKVAQAIANEEWGTVGQHAENAINAMPNTLALGQIYATLAVADETRRLADVQEAALLLNQLQGQYHTIEDEALSWDDGTAREDRLNGYIRWRNDIRAEVRKLIGR